MPSTRARAHRPGRRPSRAGRGSVAGGTDAARHRRSAAPGRVPWPPPERRGLSSHRRAVERPARAGWRGSQASRSRVVGVRPHRDPKGSRTCSSTEGGFPRSRRPAARDGDGGGMVLEVGGVGGEHRRNHPGRRQRPPSRGRIRARLAPERDLGAGAEVQVAEGVHRGHCPPCPRGGDGEGTGGDTGHDRMSAALSHRHRAPAGGGRSPG